MAGPTPNCCLLHQNPKLQVKRPSFCKEANCHASPNSPWLPSSLCLQIFQSEVFGPKKEKINKTQQNQKYLLICVNNCKCFLVDVPLFFSIVQKKGTFSGTVCWLLSASLGFLVLLRTLTRIHHRQNTLKEHMTNATQQ